MMKQVLTFLFTFVLALTTMRVSAAKYDWKVYASYHNATKSLEMGGRIYILANGDLYSYGPDDQSIETYDKAGELNDFGIYDIQACSSTGEVVIIYSNGSIDLLKGNGDVFNVSDLKTKSLSDKTMNDVCIDGTMLYISTNSGLAVLDVAKHSFKNIYHWGYAVQSACTSGGYIIASTSDGVYRGQTSVNLLDPANWEKISSNADFAKFLKVGNTMFGMSDKMYRITDLNTMTATEVSNDKVTNSFVCGGKVFFNTIAQELKSVDEAGSVMSYITPYPISYLTQSSNSYWAACGENGFVGMSLSGITFAQIVGDITPNSPVRNNSYTMDMIGERLLVTGGNCYRTGVNYTGQASVYENGKWTAFDEKEALASVPAQTYLNAVSIAQDPNDSEHHFLSTRSSGVYEFRNYKLQKHYTHYKDDSYRSADKYYAANPLLSYRPFSSHYYYYVMMGGLKYDGSNNLWMCNEATDTIIRILTPSNKWIGYYFEEIARMHVFEYIMFDKRGWAWINSKFTLNYDSDTERTSEGGIFILNTNGTIETQKDDTHKFYHKITNQDGLSYEIDRFYCMAEDMDGDIWLGTTSGVFVAKTPENVFSSDYQFTQIKVPRNDGTGLADYLLNGVWATCIAVDGANRKWIGTGGSGMYLISADGQEELYHFTKSNSPLISDNINDIKINGKTGEVFISTDAGVCSYTSDAIDAEQELDKNKIKVYPNPIRPESRQLVRATGLSYNTNVKIANAAGRLVYEGTSVGGEFTWNCKTSGGKAVSTGVYYILATDEDGKKGAAAKVLIVR